MITRNKALNLYKQKQRFVSYEEKEPYLVEASGVTYRSEENDTIYESYLIKRLVYTEN